MIPGITQRKMNPNTDMQGMGDMRRRSLLENSERSAGTGGRSGAATASVGAGKSEPEAGQQKSAGTLSVGIVQSFHERINKLRTLIK